ncbi:thiamine-phosphate kinase [Brevundimonas subvibrioides]|uniref:Thiamine-monophosphate kinase n=1 Tax=Brevundimonas subvibrioides (strain ATCC 15264 / DSM 4735 / LMG 14903 / NBRC 16000 / CB 81) TaxID=633149 RepID=D9QHN5_BRESC|nr:thiamine-phosphate kinase [Brevundimonas subvibrioides]ADL01201.1 thiamine-monophosphate kinase [Brevundimonas subvibrioides ATCC 15264]
MAALDAAGEFETIRTLLAPLAHPDYARDLLDDVAVLPSRAGFDLVLTKDAIVEGVHFLPDDPLDQVAQKLLRVNLSDLAAKGAEPFGYLLACHWSPRCGWPEREAFAAGLKADQDAFGVALLGGDTVATPGPASFSVTMLGWVPKGQAVARSGAKAGHAVYVTGTIGDGWLGLQAARGRLSLEPERVAALAEHYRRPVPRVDFGTAIRGLPTAAVDVSDGLVADLAHVAGASGVGIALDLEATPLSAAAHAWLDARTDPQAALETLVTGGDDYEIALSVHPLDEARLKKEADRLHLRLTRIGEVVAGKGVSVRYLGQPVTLGRTGWTHD